MACETPPASVTYSNHCNKAGYYSDCVSPFTYQNSTCYNWTNAGDCGSYHVNNTAGCYQNVAHNNWADNRNWSNSPACGTNTNSCSFGNSCAWGGNFCNFGNSCSWGGDWSDCNHGNSCSFWDYPGWSDTYCVHEDWNAGGEGYTDHWDAACHSYWTDTIPAWSDSCYSGYSDSCGSYSTWGDSCYSGYPDSCETSWGDSCYSGYPDSCYYYADHNNTPPFNNFCNHSNVNN